MTQEPPEFSNWQEAWEWEAAQTSQRYAEMTEEELLTRIRQGYYDSYYTIWYRLREKSTLARATPVLLEVLRREAGASMSLIRYHCAGALFYLMGYADDPLPPLRSQVQWDHAGEPARQEAIDELEQVIAEMMAN